MSRVRRGWRWPVLAVAAAAAALCGTGVASASQSWMVTPVPPIDKSTAQMFAVSCHSAVSCVAVGYNNTKKLVAYRWQDGSWTLRYLPTPADSSSTFHGSFTGVSCYAEDGCVIVGSYTTGGTTLPLAEQWNGRAWTILPSPAGQPGAVSCLSATSCTAVGTGTQSGLAEYWNGTSWSVEPTPQTGTVETNLNSVSCPSPTFCMAAGEYYKNAMASVALTETWNGSSWTVQHTPYPAGGTYQYLHGVSCSSATACTAVGGVQIIRWNGTGWSAQSSSAGVHDLYGVSCPAAASCTAAGVGSTGDSLVTYWNGTAWVTQTTPEEEAYLFGVSCPRPAFCMAVGGLSPIENQSEQALAEDN